MDVSDPRRAAMPWPLERVALFDPAGMLTDDWIGYVLPLYLGGLPNENSQAPYTLDFQCGTRWVLAPGDLGDVVLAALMVHQKWCQYPLQRVCCEPDLLGKITGLSVSP